MLQSIGAIITGFAVVAVFSFGADFVLHTAGAEYFDENGRSNNPAILSLTLSYVSAFTIVGSYIAARLAPRRPVKHALILGAIILLINGAGTLSLWGTAPAWYHIASLLLVIPCAFLGGWLRNRQIGSPDPLGSRFPLFSR
jgi:hypothetical protein